MIVPSIDLMGGQTVQLVGGRDKALEAGDPRPIALRFSVAGEIAVIDLDAALGKGSNEALIKELIRLAPCRVGGGIRDVDRALDLLDAGASKIILGTRAEPELLRLLPKERVLAALDAVDGEVVVEGWRTKTGRRIEERMLELRELVGGFLVTFVEREGRMQGLPMERIAALRDAAGAASLTVAGGVTTAEEVGELARLGIDAQVGMALYTGRLPLADAVAAPLVSERPDGLWPTVVCDEQGTALGLVWSSKESVRRAVETGRGVYHSRKRGIWEKGATSGAFQELLRIDVDCDCDALRFIVRQHGTGFCHRGERTCWGADKSIGELYRRITARAMKAPPQSYTRKLFDDPELLRAKVREEAQEVNRAETAEELTWEAADLLYFLFVSMARKNVTLEQVEKELQRRSLAVRRRGGAAKEPLKAAPEKSEDK